MGVYLFLLAALEGATGAVRGSMRGNRSYHFVQITDLHLEPFYSPERHHPQGDVCRTQEAYNISACAAFEVVPNNGTYPWGRLNCDPPRLLLHSMAHAIRNVSRRTPPDFILFTGDSPSHVLSCQHHVARTIELVAELMSKEFADIAPVYPMMGNNDYFPNYNVSLEPDNDWQKYIGSMYKRWGMLSGEQLKTFRRGGFYSVSPNPGLKLLVLNTVVWSHKVLDWGRSPKLAVDASQVTNQSAYSGDAPFPDAADDDGWTWNTESTQNGIFLGCGDRQHDPYGQLAWARKELEQSRDMGQRVLIAGHVPPGNKVGENNFCSVYNKAMIQLSRDFADTIEAQLYGDHSTDEFRMFWSEESDGQEAHAVSSVLVSAGVTPRKHCNPSWRMFDVSTEHHLTDFTQYYFPLIDANMPVWNDWAWEKASHAQIENFANVWWKKQYSFREEYGYGLSPADLENLWRDMQSKAMVLAQYTRNMFSQTIGTKDYFDYLCDMRYIEKAPNHLCSEMGRLLERDNPKDQKALAEATAKLRTQALAHKSNHEASSKQTAVRTYTEQEQAAAMRPLAIGLFVLGNSSAFFALTTALLAYKLVRSNAKRVQLPLLP